LKIDFLNKAILMMVSWWIC